MSDRNRVRFAGAVVVFVLALVINSAISGMTWGLMSAVSGTVGYVLLMSVLTWNDRRKP